MLKCPWDIFVGNYMGCSHHYPVGQERLISILEEITVKTFAVANLSKDKL
jgi:hypothetical protein